MAFHRVTLAPVSKDDDILWFEISDFRESVAVPIHCSVAVQVFGCQAFDSRFAAGKEVVGDERAAVVFAPFISITSALIIFEGIDDFRVQAEGFLRNDGFGEWSFVGLDNGDHIDGGGDEGKKCDSDPNEFFSGSV